MRRDFDYIDRRIMDELQANGRLSIVELASRVNLTKTPCAERVRRLEREGVLSGYRAVLNHDAVGHSNVAIVHLSLTKSTDKALRDFNRAVTSIPEVQSCLMIAGNFDYLLKVRTRDMAHFREVLGDRIGTLPHVQTTHSFAVMEVIKDSDEVTMTPLKTG